MDSTFVEGGAIRKKGVIEILSSNFKLGRLKFHGDNLAMTPTSVAYTPAQKGVVYAISGVGLSSYLWNR